MTRVAFVIPTWGDRWLGGIAYIRNLLSALRDEPVGIRPVALVSSTVRESLPDMEHVRSAIFAKAPLRVARDGIRRVTGWDPLLERLLRRERIQVLSHSGLTGTRSRIPSINWIPDLQHRRLPEFFGRGELRERDRTYDRVCRESRLVVASSEAAGKDLEEFFPSARGKVRVLRFVDLSACEGEATDPGVLALRYALEERYFLVPNQFWAHKNHGVILRALRILKDRGRRVRVLATGRTSDYRRPGHFAELMKLRADAGLEDRFSCLGVVPHADLVGLERGAVALINPSLFEGWSTSVEEAKSLGKKILLSDIDVHREQAPERGALFDPNDAEALAELMWRTWESFDRDEEARAGARAAAALPDRRRRFAEAYAAIAGEAVAHPRERTS